MKLFISAVPVSVFLISALFAEEKIYPLDLKIQVYPQEICYGDPCFLVFSVSNKGQETLYLPYGKTFLPWMGGGLYHREKELFSWYMEAYNKSEGTMDDSNTEYSFPGHPVKPGETLEFHIRMIWFPMPEFAQDEQAKELLRLVNEGEREYTIQFSYCLASYYGAYYCTFRPLFNEHGRFLSREDFPADELDQREFEARGYKLNLSIDTPPHKCPVRILPRPEDEVKLLQEWYLELPTAASADMWTMEHVFAHPYHARNSPFKMEAPTPFELGRKRDPFNEAYRAFFQSMETRTPESLARIKRTNDLGAQIIERSKLPDSTISQNIVEFIQLRGFLVDMRYAKDEDTEMTAFEKLLEFVDTAKDKELWVKFLDEIGLYSIMHHTYFPTKKVEHYRELLRERFTK